MSGNGILIDMIKAVFIDRDGTLIEDVPYCSRVEDVRLFPGAAKAIALLSESGYKVIVVTNQSGIGRGYFSDQTVQDIHEHIKSQLALKGACIEAFYYCPHTPMDECGCRKPNPGLIIEAKSDFDIDLSQSFIVGDSLTDVEAGQKVGVVGVLLGSGHGNDSRLMPDHVAAGILGAAEWIVSQPTK